MKKDFEELHDLAKEALKKYGQKEDILVELSDIVVRSSKLMSSFENLKEEALSQEAYKKKVSTSRSPVENTPDVNKVAYFLSLYDHFDISDEQKPTPAIRKMAEKLGVKTNTLRSKRDIFDKRIKEQKEKLQKSNPKLVVREGWRSDLGRDLQKTFDECKNMSHSQLLAEVQAILGLDTK